MVPKRRLRNFDEEPTRVPVEDEVMGFAPLPDSVAVDPKWASVWSPGMAG